MSRERAVRWVVSGRVQGVGFRWYTMKAASRLGVVGWVRNLPDGTVEVVGAGPDEAIEQLDAAVRSGPSFSRVDHVDATDVSLDMNYVKSFEIK